MKRSPMPARKKPLARKAPIKRGVPLLTRSEIKRSTAIKPVNRKRKAETTERAYGSKARRDAVTQLDCQTCGREATPDYPNQQSHVETGGMGYKADKDRLVIQCPSCHRAFHDSGSAAAYERECGMEPGTMDALADELTRLCDARGLN